MSVPERLLGVGAMIMALCCAVLPLAGAAPGGGLIAGVVALAAVVYAVTRRRRPGAEC